MTVSEQEAASLSLTAVPVPREAAQHVLEYISWNKSLIGENLAATERLDRYFELVRSMREGVHVVIDDPYERATALLFELVLSEEFNPWAIDLVRFTQLYLERIKVSGMDFPVAGRLLYMAWNILFLQSEEILSSRKETQPQVDASAAVGSPVDDGYLGEMNTPEEIDVTTAILTTQTPPFEAMVRHAETRPVTLMELTHAFQEAEKDAKLAMEADLARQRLRAELAKIPTVLVHGEEVPLGDLSTVWEVATRHGVGEQFSVSEIFDGVTSRERVVSLFLSLLFMVRGGAIDLKQDCIGKSSLFIVRAKEEMDPRAILIGEPDTIVPARSENN